MTVSLSIPVYITFPSVGVVQPPVACTGENATFTCRVNAPDASWKINGSYWLDLSSTVQGDIHIDRDTADISHKLIILAKPEYNNTEVRCVALGSERNDSETVHLYVG